MGATLPIAGFLNKINQFIINPIILLVFAVAFLIFFYGIFEFIRGAGEMSRARDDGKKKIWYGLLGMFIMFSAYGIIRIILNTIGLNNTPYINP
ncbi:MAG: hypothetical protein M3Q24_00025 [bacterium]|nr:hypothetical protein [bacterium]